MTPAIKLLRKKGITHQVHRYQHDPDADSYGLEAAQKLAVEPGRVFKTLLAQLDNGPFVVALAPVNSQLNLKNLARAAGARKAQMANKDDARRVTGYLPGGISPLGQKKQLPTLFDRSALHYPTLYVSAGRRGLEIELDSNDLRRLCRATLADLCQP